MQSNQYYLSLNYYCYTVHDLIPLYSLLVDKVEDNGVDPYRGYISTKLLRAILIADQSVQIYYYSHYIYLWDYYNTKLETSSRDIY
jgi:hypothetical protein